MMQSRSFPTIASKNIAVCLLQRRDRAGRYTLCLSESSAYRGDGLVRPKEALS